MPFVYFSLVSCKKKSHIRKCMQDFFARMLLFLQSGVLFHRFRGDGRRGLCAVAYLRVGRARADRAPCLTARHAHADHRYQYK